MEVPSIDINDRIKVIKPPVGHPGLLGSKLRVVAIGDGYVDVMVPTATVSHTARLQPRYAGTSSTAGIANGIIYCPILVQEVVSPEP